MKPEVPDSKAPDVKSPKAIITDEGE